MDGFILIMLVIAGALFLFSVSRFHRTAERKRQEEITRSSRQINQKVNEYLEQGIRPAYSEIRSKRNEYMLEEANFDLYRYKSTGQVAGHGFRYRVKLAQGLTYNVGVGQLHANKDWQKDDKTLVTISNQAIICTSATISKRFTWTSLAKLEVFANGFVLTPSRGAVLMFECEEPTCKHHAVLALLIMEQEKSGTLASAHIRQDDNTNYESQSSDSSSHDTFNKKNDFANEDRVNPFHKRSATNDVDDIASGFHKTKSRSMSHEVMREKEKVARKLKKWAINQHQINAQILNAFLKLKRYGNGRVTVSMMRNQLSNIKSFQSNFDQMKSISPKNHGKVFDVSGDLVTIWLIVEAEVLEYERVVFPDIDC